MIFTSEYLNSAPHADVTVVYPDGATHTTRALADGNGVFVAGIRDAIAFERGSRVVECSRNLDRIRKSHAEAHTRTGHERWAWAANTRSKAVTP